jgi:hypothetical protein
MRELDFNNLMSFLTIQDAKEILESFQEYIIVYADYETCKPTERYQLTNDISLINEINELDIDFYIGTWVMQDFINKYLDK